MLQWLSAMGRNSRASMSVLGLLLATGCLGSESERMDRAEELAECRGGASDDEVQENILISEEYALGLAADLEHSWAPVLYALDFSFLWAQTLSGAVGEPPVGWTFADGTYHYGSNAAAIEMRASLTQDLEYGPAGTLVAENILVLDSYLANAVVVFDDSTNVTTIAYDQPGPLVELLGLGAAPPNPITLDEAQRASVVESLSSLALEPDFIAYGITRSTLVDYHVASPPRAISALSTGNEVFDLELVAVNASRDVLDQTLSTVEWAVVREGNKVKGYTTFSTSGGHFSFRGRVDFTDVPLTVIAERTLACP